MTFFALLIVILLVYVVVGFIRGLERSLATSGGDDVVLVYSINAKSNIENSSIGGQIPELLAASVRGIQRQNEVPMVSREIFMGTRIRMGEESERGKERFGLIRGVTKRAVLVRKDVRISEGDWPGAGELLVGRLAAAKLGLEGEQLTMGRQVEIEGRTWTVAGAFVASGTALESEIWCNLADLQSATQRQDLTLVALKLEAESQPALVDLFCKERLDLELQAIGEIEYYQALQKHYRPVRILAWMVVFLVSGSGIFAGLNMMYGAVKGREREFATLQAMGFRRSAVVISIVQESTLVSMAASLTAGAVAVLVFDGYAVRFTMGAFAMQIDSWTIMFGCCVGLLMGFLGALPPALNTMRANVAVGLKAI